MGLDLLTLPTHVWPREERGVLELKRHPIVEIIVRHSLDERNNSRAMSNAKAMGDSREGAAAVFSI